MKHITYYLMRGEQFGLLFGVLGLFAGFMYAPLFILSAFGFALAYLSVAISTKKLIEHFTIPKVKL